MFFKANKTIPSQEKYLQRMRQLGAQFDASTSEEVVNYYMTIGIDNIVPGMQFMEDAIRYPLFLTDELVRERPVVTGEFDRAESNPFFQLNRATGIALWTPQYYSHKNTIGDRKVILSTTQAKMQAIQKMYYVPNNTALILAGDVTAAKGFKLAEEIFGDWPKGEDPFAKPIPEPPPLAHTQAVIVEQPVNGATLTLTWQGPSVTRDPASTYAADVLSSILSKPTSAFQKRLVQSGLTVGASLGYYTQAHVGPISASIQTTPDKLLDAEKALLEEIGKLADPNYITAAELLAAQKELAVRALYEREQVSTWVHGVSFWWAVTGLDYYRDYVPNMQKVTRDDIARYAKTYLQGKPFVVGAMLSPADRKKIALTTTMLLPKEKP
jgi:zinc protease